MTVKARSNRRPQRSSLPAADDVSVPASGTPHMVVRYIDKLERYAEVFGPDTSADRESIDAESHDPVDHLMESLRSRAWLRNIADDVDLELRALDEIIDMLYRRRHMLQAVRDYRLQLAAIDQERADALTVT